MILRQKFLICLAGLVLGGLIGALTVSANIPVDLKGEKISYGIKKLGMKIGDATLQFVGPTHLDQKNVILIIFRATGFNFLDEEKIYADPKTYLPIRIERNLNIFGDKQRIVEYYSQNPFQVRVVKTTQGKTDVTILKKDASVDNIYCFIARYRQQGKFEKGVVLELNLPTQRVAIALKDKQRIVASGKIYEAYFMETQPAKYRVWFDSSDQKIPLRIDGTSQIGPTTMVMKGYQK